MKVYVLIQDETDYNGERTIFGVFKSFEDAEKAKEKELEKAYHCLLDFYHLENEETVQGWVPNFYIEEAEYFSKKENN